MPDRSNFASRARFAREERGVGKSAGLLLEVSGQRSALGSVNAASARCLGSAPSDRSAFWFFLALFWLPDGREGWQATTAQP